MKKFLSASVFSFFCFIAVAPLVKAQDYDGPVFKQQIPVHRENRGLDIRHDSVKWGGKKLAWVSALRIRVCGNYSKSSPSIIQSTRTTSLIRNSRVNKRR